jgi:excisionase family DNA binding protein
MTLTVKQVAILLSCTELALYKRVSRNEIPYRKWGKKILFLKTDIEQFLQGLPGLTLHQIH